MIRDSDGTKLSDELLNAGYGIYSTICLIREHNEWIADHPYASQQAFLCTAPVTATGDSISIRLMDGFFEDQFRVNDDPESLLYWQVYDRTADIEVPRELWSYRLETGEVNIKTLPWRQYTVSFLAWRIWEEISMYNHITNNWNKEHLMQLNPYEEDVMGYLKDWLTLWCEEHPHTTVVRFTSLFYNFAWIWGRDERNRYLFTDWASYDFTVCPAALNDFEKEYGYALKAEDFVRQGKYNSTHRVPSYKKRDWMEFIGGFIRSAFRELTDIVHAAGKQAFVFYDDSWVGLEPYSGSFSDFGFDGIIKCVFSGYEARLCADVPVTTHEIRFHHYLFPVGLGGAPTFSAGGHPGEDALNYWVSVRRALLRRRIERCGLGGYLHLVQDYPDFVEAMDRILAEFDLISSLHDCGAPYNLKPKIGILHAWGKLRSWTLSGHFHETYNHTLIHVLESLSGQPFDVSFLSFDDIHNGVPCGVDVIINAGEAGSSWSGGSCWSDKRVVDNLTKWVHGGGVFFGIGEPSALDGYHNYLRMAHVLGVDIDNGERACQERWTYSVKPVPGLQIANTKSCKNVVLTDGTADVLSEHDGFPVAALHTFGKGKGVYLADFDVSPESKCMLQKLILHAVGGNFLCEGLSDNPHVECAVFPGKLVFINNSTDHQTALCVWDKVTYTATLAPRAMSILEINS